MAKNLWKRILGVEQPPAPDLPPPNFLDLCEHKVLSVVVLANGGNLLNQRQCLDLSSKLPKIVHNIRGLVSQCEESAVTFRPALENLYRYLDKANVLVTSCGAKHWWEAAVFQTRNEHAFRVIVLDVGLCYNAIYEQAKSMSGESSVLPNDLRHPSESVFVPAGSADVQGDQEDLQRRLEELARDPSSVNLQSQPLSEDAALKAQSLAKYLLLKLNYTSGHSQATTLETGSEMLWTKENETSGTWGSSDFLGGSAGGGVCSTEWLGIPCAKKIYHFKEHEIFFLKEAGILAHLKHPGIVNFFCCGNHGEEIGKRFIAMELMEKNLYNVIEDQILKGVYFPLHVVLDIIMQIARGMWYLHDQGVAHRDLKPHNVVVDKMTYSEIQLENHFCVKLVDFGTSKTEVEVSRSNTVTALGIGTTTYRAPEISPSPHASRKGKANWFKADVFSFAMTCAHVLCLQMTLRGNSEESTSEELDGGRPKIPKYYNPKDSELVALLKECWKTNPRERPSFQEICIRLENFRNKCWRGEHANEVVLGGLDFIKEKLEEQSSFQKIISYSNSDDFEEVGDFKMCSICRRFFVVNFEFVLSVNDNQFIII